ncbi:MAG TPA: hypothetical protein VFS54_12660 [Solirubrobacterales bacterium]|nr:hypothetical protein [Solirubrobacterales bacterium]
MAATPENDRPPSPKPIIRDPEADPTLKRDRLLQRVRAARRHLSQVSGTIPRVQ